jgi:hypothetical protein
MTFVTGAWTQTGGTVSHTHPTFTGKVFLSGDEIRLDYALNLPPYRAMPMIMKMY